MNSALKFARKQPPIRLILAGACVVLLFALVIEMAARPKPSPYVAEEIRAIKDRGVLRVALRDDVAGFALYSAEQDAWSGIEADVARAVAFSIFGEEGRVEFIASTSRTALARLDNMESDITFAQISAIGTRYGYTGSYYTDAYAVMTLSSAGLSTLGSLSGGIVGVVQDADAPRPDSPPELEALAEYGQERGQTHTFKVFASYPELMTALNDKDIDAALMKAALLPKYFHSGAKVMGEALSLVPYCAAVRKAETGLLEIASTTIEEMRGSGELEKLRQKYSLPAF